MSKRIMYPKWLVILCTALLFAVLVLNLLFPMPLQAVKSRSAVVNASDGQWIAGFSVENGRWRLPANLPEIDPLFIERLIAIEDSRYWKHSGVDVLAIGRAARSWRRAGRPVSGASTITMQLVRQIEPRPRTLGFKMLEAVRALQYEVFLSKEEILSLYLTHISYGGNLEGISAASWAYLGKPPEALTDAEIALLIAIPQAPEARRPDLKPKAAKAARDLILNRQKKAGLIDDLKLAEAIEEPLMSKRRSIPQTAWLTARTLARQNSTVVSSLDAGLQKDIESLISRRAVEMPDEVNVAVIVVENETMAVRTHIASAGLERAGGWIDMTRQMRSPGSALKPFIYAMAIDEGLISSGSVIDDLPTRFGHYQPENFDRRYHGQVRIYEALRHSLNVPAVAILDRLGGARFENELIGAGLKIERLGAGNEKAGLAVALGGLGTTANDLAQIYAALANGGELRALRWYEDNTESIHAKPVRILSEKAASDITAILRQAPTPDGRVPAWLSKDHVAIAYKTGTSYGFRDAWAAGYSDKWTVVVWTGRPDGAPHIGQTGRTAAAPLLFDVFAVLPENGQQIYRKDEAAPEGLKRVKDYVETGPQIQFPPDGSKVLAKDFGPTARGFTLSARTENEAAKFYVSGEPIKLENGRAIWRPDTPGFYRIVAVDAKGREAISNVRVLSFNQLADSRL